MPTKKKKVQFGPTKAVTVRLPIDVVTELTMRGTTVHWTAAEVVEDIVMAAVTLLPPLPRSSRRPRSRPA